MESARPVTPKQGLTSSGLGPGKTVAPQEQGLHSGQAAVKMRAERDARKAQQQESAEQKAAREKVLVAFDAFREAVRENVERRSTKGPSEPAGNTKKFVPKYRREVEEAGPAPRVAAVANDAAVTRHPWQVTLTTAAGATTAHVRPGTLNNLLPTGVIGALTITESCSICLEVTTDGKKITALEYSVETGPPPPPPECSLDSAPTEFLVPLAYILEGDTIAEATVYQLQSASLIARVVLCGQTEKTAPAANVSPWHHWWTWIVGTDLSDS